MSSKLVYRFIAALSVSALNQHVLPGTFELLGRSGVPPMHAALLPSGNVVFIDKVENYTEARLNNGRYAYSAIFNPDTHELRPQRISSNAFCCGGGFLADGTLMTMGGNGPLSWLDDTVADGFDALRYLYADNAKQGGDWIEYNAVKMFSKRWYASVQTLSDGKVFIISGSLNGMDIRDPNNNNPTYELLDKYGKPYDGNVFIFTSKASQIFNVHAGRVERRMPNLPGLHRTYPNTGGSVMLPLTAKNNYSAEIMICGGGRIDEVESPTDNTCGIIKPMDEHAQWTITHIPDGGRIMVEGILLLDETVLWLNGAQVGCQGFGTASKPALDALVYNPRTYSWSKAGHSRVPRLYHSVALMLLDGTILVAGSNPNEMPVLEDDIDPSIPSRAYPTEFRVERYTPSYLLDDKADLRPRDIEVMATVLVPGETVSTIFFTAAVKPKDFKVLLYHGGFVTHAVHMGQVMIEMEDLGLQHIEDNRYKMAVMIPDIKIAPGPYVIYLVLNGVPGMGRFVSVQTD